MNELDGVQTLHDYRVLDAGRDEVLDDYVEMAAHLCETPIALITFLDDKQQWHQARKGIEIAEAPRGKTLPRR